MKHRFLRQLSALILLNSPFILSSQNVGIANSNPESKLHINTVAAESGLIIEDAGTTSTSDIQFRRTGDPNVFKLTRELLGATNSSYLDLKFNNNALMTLRGNGNIGINNLSPDSKLDVSGDINLTGNLKVASQNGNSGQVLSTLPDGSTAWADVNTSRFKNFKEFSTDQSWDIPDGVTEICVEAWGAGGGTKPGASYSGGGGGGYIKVILPVDHTINVNIDIGNGEKFLDGENTIVTHNLDIITAFAGKASSTTRAGDGGKGGTTNNPNHSLLSIDGESGHPPRIEYHQTNSTTFTKFTYGGDGGNCPLIAGSGGKGGTHSHTSTGGIVTITDASDSKRGGGAGGSVNSLTSGDGFIRIHW